MTSEASLVSVVIPVFNARDTLREAVESVRAQTYRNLEIILVDDASSDQSIQEISDLIEQDARIRVLRHDVNAGLPATRNTGIHASRGAYLTFIDADDVWHPWKVERQVAKMEQSAPEVGVVYSWCTYMDPDGFVIPNRVFAATFEGDVFASLLEGNFINNTLMVRREYMDAVGGYRAALRGGHEDLQIYLDLAERCDFVVVPEFLTAYRLSAHSKSHDVWRMKRCHDEVLASVRARHPELPGWLLRSSSSNQLYFLAFQCVRAHRFLEAIHLLGLTFWRDPAFFKRPVMWGAFERLFARALRKEQVRAALPPRRLYLDGGPPPTLHVPQETNAQELQRKIRIAGVKVRKLQTESAPDHAYYISAAS